MHIFSRLQRVFYTIICIVSNESRCGMSSPDVFDQIITVVDSVGAVGTGIRSFPSVDKQMPLQIRLLVGAVGAAWAGIRPVEG